MKTNLYATVAPVISLEGTINVTATEPILQGVITAGFFIPCFIGGAKGFAVAPTAIKTLRDVDGYILKDNSGYILTVTEGEKAWLTNQEI